MMPSAPRRREPLASWFMPLAVCVGVGVTGCAPVFQDARLAPPGQVEVTPAFSGVGFADEDDSEYLAHTFGGAVLIGVHDRVNVGVGYARFEDRGFEGGVNAVGAGVKIGLKRDRIAVGLPVTVQFGEDVDTGESLQFHPTVLFTVPLGARADFNPSARLLVPTCDDCDMLVGFNSGFGLRPFGTRVTLRPEIGILLNPGESGVLWTAGIGVSIRSFDR